MSRRRLGADPAGSLVVALYPDSLRREWKVATLSHQLSWSHFVELIEIDDATRRAFYTDLCAQSRWSLPPQQVPPARLRLAGVGGGDA